MDYAIVSTAEKVISPSRLMEELDKISAEPINHLTIKINYSLCGYRVTAFQKSHQEILAKWLSTREYQLLNLNLDENSLNDRHLVGIINSIVCNPHLKLDHLSVSGNNLSIETLKYIFHLETHHEIDFMIDGLGRHYEDVREGYNALNSIEASDLIHKINAFNEVKPNRSAKVINSVIYFSQGLEKLTNHKIPSYLAKGIYCLK